MLFLVVVFLALQILDVCGQKESWSWGYADKDGDGNRKNELAPPFTVSPKANQTNSQKPPLKRPDGSVNYEAKFEVCRPLPYNPPKFDVPGRRISQRKCYEYIWDIKYRKEESSRKSDCTKAIHRDEGIFSTAAVGGRDTVEGEFPHMGAIGWKAVIGTWVFKCGGSLISPKFVLTAGHCTRASSRDSSIEDPLPKIVRLGDKNILDTSNNKGFAPVNADINRIIPHPAYKSPSKYNDIALFELKVNVQFSPLVHPACLWGSFDLSKLGTQATLTGWGVVEAGSRDISPELQAADVDVIDAQQCDSLLRPWCNRNWCGIQDNQLCAGKLTGGVDACQGDSGGPLQVKIPLPASESEKMHYVIGVTSFGIGCALPNTPGVYARVSNYIDWIESIVWS